MFFFVWFDDSSKKPAAEKLREAMAAYAERFQARPTLVLLNSADQIEAADVTVRYERTVQPNSFWLGREDNIDLAAT